MRYVPENSDGEVEVGSPVKAKDPNDDTLSYTLGGADAGLFTIVQTDDDATTGVDEEGQIQVKARAMLDHETKPTHTVTLRRLTRVNATDTITVTIHVTDVDEAPEIMQVSTENQAPVFRSSSTTRSIPEGQSSGRAIGARVTAPISIPVTV